MTDSEYTDYLKERIIKCLEFGFIHLAIYWRNKLALHTRNIDLEAMDATDLVAQCFDGTRGVDE